MTIWFDVDTALSEVPVNAVPLTDDTDFKTVEETVAYNATGMGLYWHFTATGGATSVTAVTPTTGGLHDWAHQDHGIYTIAIPAAASSASDIANDTEGFGYFTGVCDGVLPWRSPTFGFRAAGLNNVLIDSAYSATRGLSGTALPDAAADAAGGLPISTTGSIEMDDVSKLADGGLTAATFAADTNVYTAVINVNDDAGAGTAANRYVCYVYKNGVLLAHASITDPVLAVYSTADGTLFSSSSGANALTKSSASSYMMYLNETTDLMTAGVGYGAELTATIDSATRIMAVPQLRDTAAP